MKRERTYKVNDRKTLNKGDFFRVKGGPYYLSKRGKKLNMASKGPMMFMYYCEKDGQHWIEAYSAREKAIVVLSLDDNRESFIPGNYVPRAYSVVGGVSPKKQAKLVESLGGKRALPATRGRRGAISSPKKQQATPKPEAVTETSEAIDGRKIVQQVLGGFTQE